jgi:hypothetical protein
MKTLYGFAGCRPGNKPVGAVGRPVVNGYPETVVCHVQDEVFPHHCEADQANVIFAHILF